MPGHGTRFLAFDFSEEISCPASLFRVVTDEPSESTPEARFEW
jgi:hypothetical protein